MRTKLLRIALAGGLGITVGVIANAASLDLNRLFGVAKDLGTAAAPMPEKDEIALGRELAGRTLGAAPLINDRALQGYVNRVGRAIAAQSTRPDLPWRFGVMDTPSINAFASPGGIILITRGLYEILDNEAQLAGILGHEVAHVAKYHHASVVRKQAGTSALAGIGQEVAAQRIRGGGGAASNLVQQALGEGAEIFSKGLDRSAELEADEVGAILAVRAGYSAGGLIDVLHKLGARSAEPSMKLLYATHPHPNERLTALGDALAPQMAKLPEGQEPPLQVAAADLPAPSVASAPQGAPAAGRALAGGEQQQQQESGGLQLPMGGQQQRGGRTGNPLDGFLRGIR